MRKCIVPLLALCLIAIPGVAFAQDDPPLSPTPPEFAPPAPAPVVDTDSAGAFAKLYVFRNAARLARDRRERVRVLNVDSSCLQAPFLATRFGCVFTLRALIIQRRHGWDWAKASHKSSRGGHGRKHNRRFRVRLVGCLGALRVDGGPTVTPTATLQALECRRIQRSPDDDVIVAPSDS